MVPDRLSAVQDVAAAEHQAVGVRVQAAPHGPRRPEPGR
jgi:hypothetical protein